MARKKRIAVIGLGAFGNECAIALAKDCEILALDLSQKVVNDIVDKVDQARRVDARDFEALAQLITTDFDAAVVSLGVKLEDNILAVLNLLNIGLKRIHAKVVSRAHAEILQALGNKYAAAINLIFPEQQAAERLASQVLHPNVLENIAMTQGYAICEIVTPDKFAGKTLAELQIRRDYNVYVIAVHEYLPENTIFMPRPDFICKPSDSLVVIGQEESIDKIRELA